ncbi:MAG: secretin N-terminal domain-containing protein [Bacillota bacterium]
MKRIQTFACALAVIFWLTGTAPAAEDTPISLRLHNADVNTVLRTLAAMGNVGLVVDDAVTGKITLQLEQVPFAQALEIVLKAKNLALQKIGHTLIVSTPENISKGFGSIHVVKLRYAKSKEVKEALSVVLPKDKIQADESSNSLVFSGTPEQFAEVARVVAVLDKEMPQVVIEAEVVEIYRDSAKELGLEWAWTSIPDKSAGSAGRSTDTAGANKDYGSAHLFKTVNVGVAAMLKAKIGKGEGKVLAKPRIIALNSKDAHIHIGRKLPVVEYDKDGNKTVSYIETGIKLDITPQIRENNSIVSKVKTEVSDAAYNAASGGYEVSTRESETTVRLQDGDTLVIGGLYNSNINKTMVKVPFFGDIPLLGNLFRSSTGRSNDTEVIVLLRPTIAKSE